MMVKAASPAATMKASSKSSSSPGRKPTPIVPSITRERPPSRPHVPRDIHKHLLLPTLPRFLDTVLVPPTRLSRGYPAPITILVPEHIPLTKILPDALLFALAHLPAYDVWRVSTPTVIAKPVPVIFDYPGVTRSRCRLRPVRRAIGLRCVK